MPHVEVNGTQIFYEEFGNGKETILFSHGLLWSHKMFSAQIDHLKTTYRIIAYDHRGQGQSEVSTSGYDMDTLTEDACQIIEKLAGNNPVHFVGLSMGGFVGMRLAARHKDLIKSLCLLETSSEKEVKTFQYGILNTLVALFGASAVSSKIMPIMFGPSFLNDPKRQDEVNFWKNQLESNRKTIVKAVKGVIRREGIEGELKNISCPCMIIVGEEDVATPPDKGRRIHENIAQSSFHLIKRAGHSSCIEASKEVNELLSAFIKKHSD